METYRYGWVKKIQENKIILNYCDNDSIFCLNDINDVESINVGDFVEIKDGKIVLLNKYGSFDINDQDVKYLNDLKINKMKRLKDKSNLVISSILFFAERNFNYIETPQLTNSIGEYTTDEFTVLSPLFKGKYYSLCQSPQLYKQLLISAGADKYFQLSRNFRAEKGGKTHLQEFTQIDVEIAMVDENQIIELIEEYIREIFFKSADVRLSDKIPRYSYKYICDRYKVDDPAKALKNKMYRDELGFYSVNGYDFGWIVDFPMTQVVDGKREITHHVMSRPKCDISDKKTDDIICAGYDLIINGIEVVGGDLRIYNADEQKQILDLLNYRQCDGCYNKLITALSMATPPHGGFAVGLDRLAMILFQKDHIRDVIAFPKDDNCIDEFMGAPKDYIEMKV